MKKIAALTLLASIVLWAVPFGAFGQTSGIDIGGMDRTVDPGDDFFAYSNGGWVKATEIPADRLSVGIFQGIATEVSKRTAGLITEVGKSASPEARMAGDYYTAFMN